MATLCWELKAWCIIHAALGEDAIAHFIDALQFSLERSTSDGITIR
jgi:hypothetical protein